jgi:hypothetical protein
MSSLQLDGLSNSVDVFPVNSLSVKSTSSAGRTRLHFCAASMIPTATWRPVDACLSRKQLEQELLESDGMVKKFCECTLLLWRLAGAVKFMPAEELIGAREF